MLLEGVNTYFYTTFLLNLFSNIYFSLHNGSRFYAILSAILFISIIYLKVANGKITFYLFILQQTLQLVEN